MSRKFASFKSLVMGIVLLASIVIVLMLIRGVWSSPDKEAMAVVEEFYQYEQEGEFSSSWNLFHSTMKERFSKGFYIQDRAHVFMNHFGVETFDFTLSEPEKIDQWKMSKTGPDMKSVYKILVTQTYKGSYGNFDLQQDVFAVQEKDEWKIIWDYNQ